MAAKVGDTTYLKLEGFEPPWRQGAVLQVAPGGRKLHLVVRVRSSELLGRWKDLTSFDLSGQKFIIVEGSPDRLRSQCLQPHRALEEEPAALVQQGLTALGESADLQFATASEDLPAETPAPLAKAGMTAGFLESGSDSEQTEDSADDAVFSLLRKAHKTGGAGTGGEKERQKRQRRGASRCWGLASL